MCIRDSSGTSQKAIANLGWEEIKIPAPVFVGDTLYSETEVLDKRESKSRPTQGIVKVRHIGKNQDNVVVMDMVRSFLVAKRGHSVVDKIIEENLDLGSVKVVTTQKDYFRMNEKQKQSSDYVKVDLEIENRDEFINLIKSIFLKKSNNKKDTKCKKIY